MTLNLFLITRKNTKMYQTIVLYVIDVIIRFCMRKQRRLLIKTIKRIAKKSLEKRLGSKYRRHVIILAINRILKRKRPLMCDVIIIALDIFVF